MATIAIAAALFLLPVLCPPLLPAILCASLTGATPIAVVGLAQVALVSVQSPN